MVYRKPDEKRLRFIGSYIGLADYSSEIKLDRL